MKNFINTCILLMISMVMCINGINVASASLGGFCGDNIAWELDDDGTLTLSGTGSMWDYQEINKIPWFSKERLLDAGLSDNVKKLKINEGINIIGESAFSYCAVENVILPESAEKISRYAFAGCAKLKTIYIPESVREIGFCALNGLNGLTDIYYGGDENQFKKLKIKDSVDKYGQNYSGVRNANVHYNSKVGSGDNGNKPNINQAVSGFDLKHDAWSVPNTNKGFSYSNSYNMPIERYYEVYNAVSATLLTSRQGWQVLFGSAPKGNCFGMAASAVLNYTGKINLGNYFNANNSTSLNEYGYNKQNDGFFALDYDNEVVSLIERLQVSQFTSAFSNSEVFKTRDYNKKFKQIIDYLNSDNPTPLVVCISNGLSGHALVTNTSIKPKKTKFKGNDGFYAISMYDCNTPYNNGSLKNAEERYNYAESRWLYLNPETSEWYFKINPINGKEDWWGEKRYTMLPDSFVKCYDLTSFSDKFLSGNLSVRPSDDNLYAFVSANEIDMSIGNKSFKTDVKSNGINSDFDFYPYCASVIDGNESDKAVAKVMIQNDKDEKIKINNQNDVDTLFVLKDKYMYLSTDNNSTFEVDAKKNSVILHTSDNAEFDIVLDNDDGKEYSSVNLTGVASKGIIKLSLSDDNVVAAESNADIFRANVTISSDKQDEDKTFECTDINELDGYSIDISDKLLFDSNVSEWARNDIEEAFDKDLVPDVLVGKDLTKKVDRAEFAAIAVRLYENLSKRKAEKGNNPFIDIDDNVCKNEILMAYNLDITTGTSAITFDPDIGISREQMAAMLARAYKKSKYPKWMLENDSGYPLDFAGVRKFDDDNQISDYARESVYFMVKKNIINGIGNNIFAPRNLDFYGDSYGYATREQAIIIALRCVMHL